MKQYDTIDDSPTSNDIIIQYLSFSKIKFFPFLFLFFVFFVFLFGAVCRFNLNHTIAVHKLLSVQYRIRMNVRPTSQIQPLNINERNENEANREQNDNDKK